MNMLSRHPSPAPRDPVSRVQVTLPKSVLNLMDNRIAEGNRSRFLALAAMAALSRGPERTRYMAAARAMVERGR